MSLTQAEYDAIWSPDSATQYIITDAAAWGGWVSDEFLAIWSWNQSLTTTLAIAQLWIETIDTNSNYNTWTYQYTIPSTWLYRFDANVVFWTWLSGFDIVELAIYKNSASIASAFDQVTGTTSYINAAIWVIVNATIWDTISLYIRNWSAAVGNINLGNTRLYWYKLN